MIGIKTLVEFRIHNVDGQAIGREHIEISETLIATQGDMISFAYDHHPFQQETSGFVSDGMERNYDWNRDRVEGGFRYVNYYRDEYGGKIKFYISATFKDILVDITTGNKYLLTPLQV